ncbi:MAG: SpoIIE family protein phosphatase [Ilumatobacteraceae bacterium]
MSDPEWFRAVTGVSATGRFVAVFDWSATSLGSPARWPSGLRSAVSICLTSRFPILVVWGPELCMIYNDGYREILGVKHPAAIGAPVAEVLPEVWDVIGPMFDGVLSGKGATWDQDQCLLLARNGFVEECYFTSSFSPIHDDDGAIRGVVDVVTETTASVVGARRLSCLGELAAGLVGAVEVTDVASIAVRVLSRWIDDLPSVELHLDVGDHLVLVASSRREGIVGATSVALLGSVLDEWRPRLVDVGTSSPERSYLMPVGERGEPSAAAVLVCGINPRRPWDESYRSFLELAAGAVGASLADAHRTAVELGEQRRISDALQHAMMSPTDDVASVVVRYLPAVGNLAVGGDWYDAIELADGRLALVVGDCVGHGLEAATVMGQLRSAARALLLEGCDPAAMLEGLDRFAATVDGAPSTTVCCVVVDAGTATMTYALAGHPPPVVERAGRTFLLDGDVGLPLAVGAGDRTETTVAMTPVDTIVLYTDGLIERRGEPLSVGLARLSATVSATGAMTLVEVADHLVRTMLPPHTFDDVALAIHRPHPGF